MNVTHTENKKRCLELNEDFIDGDDDNTTIKKLFKDCYLVPNKHKIKQKIDLDDIDEVLKQLRFDIKLDSDELLITIYGMDKILKQLIPNINYLCDGECYQEILLRIKPRLWYKEIYEQYGFSYSEITSIKKVALELILKSLIRGCDKKHNHPYNDEIIKIKNTALEIIHKIGDGFVFISI